MSLTKFWLVNGSKSSKKKKPVKSKKVYKPSKRKVVKRSTQKIKRPSASVMAEMEAMRRIANENAARIERENLDIHNMVPNKQGVLVMQKKKRKSTKKAVAKKAVSKKRKVAKKKYTPQTPKQTKKNRHKIVVYKQGDALRTSKKSKIAKRHYKVNSLSMAKAKGTLNQLKPALITGGISVASMIALNKGIEYIPYIKNFTGLTKSAAKVGLGFGGMVLAKKFVKNNTVANGILLGAVISAIIDVIATRSTTAITNVTTNTTPATSGIKIAGSPLSYGTPSTTLGSPVYKGLNGIRIPAKANLGAIKMPVNSMNGVSEERY